MKTPGVLRKVDNLGRIVIPYTLRQALEIENGDLLEMHCQDNTLILRKYAPACIFCGSEQDLSVYRERYICGNCLQNLKRG